MRTICASRLEPHRAARVLHGGSARSSDGNGCRRVFAVVLAALTCTTAAASAQNVTCFGKGSVLTCLGEQGGAAFQANCFGGSTFRTCTAQSGAQLVLSATPTSLNNGNISSAFQSTVSGPAVVGSAPDPAFGVRPSLSTTDPLFAPVPSPNSNPLGVASRQPSIRATRPNDIAVSPAVSPSN